LHYHKIKDETFLVVKGHIRLEHGKKVLHMRPGDFVRIPPGVKHRFRGMEDSEVMEVSTHHDETDSYRLEKSRKV
jgi:quercetin dioxygenase-like cupin family protein